MGAWAGRGPRYDVPSGGKLVELAVGGEDDEADVGVAENRQLPCLLEQPRPALAEGDLPVDGVLDPPHLHLPTSHGRWWISEADNLPLV